MGITMRMLLACYSSPLTVVDLGFLKGGLKVSMTKDMSSEILTALRLNFRLL